MPTGVDLGRVAVVLARPRIPENVGAAARAMKNMGIRKLVLVSPKDRDLARMVKMATTSAMDVIEEMKVFETMEEALAPFSYVVGTTARTGSHRKTVLDPGGVARSLIPISRENDIALVFGPEDKGLSNSDLRFCHVLVTIPTSDFASLNLAQAVLLVCWEVSRASLDTPPEWAPRLATRHELDAMYASLKDVLTRIGFINAENPEHWLDNIRRFFSRVSLTARDVKVIRGICRQIDWYTEKRLQALLGQKKEA